MTSTYESFVKFDLSQYGGEIANVTLTLNGRLKLSTPTIAISAAGTASMWAEDTINFNNRPSAADLLDTVTITSTSASNYNWNVTNWVVAERAAGRNTISVVMRGAAEISGGNFANFNASEATANRPFVVVTFQ